MEVAAVAKALVTAVECAALAAGAKEAATAIVDEVAIDMPVETEVPETAEVPTEPEAGVGGVEEADVVAEVQDAVEEALRAVSEAVSVATAEAVPTVETVKPEPTEPEAVELETVAADTTEPDTTEPETTDRADAVEVMEVAVVDEALVSKASNGDTKDGASTLDKPSPEDPDETELETEVAATAQELVNAVEAQATPSHVVSAAAVTSAVIGTLLGLIDTVELEFEGPDEWSTAAVIHPALQEADTATLYLAHRATATNDQTGNNITPNKLDVARSSLYCKAEDVAPESSNDTDLIRLPEPSPAELSAAAIGVAVVGALLDVVDVIDA
ncbi:uncharacterized protein PITG_01352 [Phytophthora infestans T30-4]|uniref:Uncharacterized protein n=1 Tax=Phytophthora infestans (strain T30-4) TaxID=403677 RepID=D0MVB1_PHYIT|nr:uncharacterized protein PITG_01352 [Phytophthora infestans T30-4]EEY61107.1 conserved hypothetical protein [Phytophthora infestans T30-4]|eukprot:XP_002908024.1 conserved hypothetical protein [Phytophthora infestans T30-4]